MSHEPPPHPELTDPRLLRLAPRDDVWCVRRPIAAGELIRIAGDPVTATRDLAPGDKLAARAIAAGEAVRKYGHPIGVATQNIAPGDWVHVHNLRSRYLPTYDRTAQAGGFTNTPPATGPRENPPPHD